MGVMGKDEVSSGDTERPGLIERAGVAVNASNLEPIEGREGAVEKVAALGLTQINRGAVEHGARDQAEIDPSAELGVVLMRFKAGRQHREAERAVYLLLSWVRHQKAYSRWKVKAGPNLLQSFVTRALCEWIWDVCPVCDGVEWQGLERDALVSKRRGCVTCKGEGRIWYAPKQPGKRSASVGPVARICPDCCGNRKVLVEKVQSVTPRECKACNGTGRRRPHDGERARALAISFEAYQKHWLRRFDWLMARLDTLDRVQGQLLRSALGGRITGTP